MYVKADMPRLAADLVDRLVRFPQAADQSFEGGAAVGQAWEGKAGPPGTPPVGK